MKIKIPNYNDYKYFNDNIYNFFLKEDVNFINSRFLVINVSLKNVYIIIYINLIFLLKYKNIKRFLTLKYFKISNSFNKNM